MVSDASYATGTRGILLFRPFAEMYDESFIFDQGPGVGVGVGVRVGVGVFVGGTGVFVGGFGVLVAPGPGVLVGGCDEQDWTWVSFTPAGAWHSRCWNPPLHGLQLLQDVQLELDVVQPQEQVVQLHIG